MPNFGGFVCNRENARIDQVSHLITPPAKRVMFNQNLKTNDGLLAQTLALQTGITYSEALISIEDLVQTTKARLEQLKQLEIDAFGTFRLNAEANYVFLPHRLNNYLHASFGLIPLQATPVVEIARGSRKTRIFRDRSEVKQSKGRKRSRSLGIKILSIAVFLMIGINAYIFFTDSNLSGDAAISTTSIHSWFDSLMSGSGTQEQPTPQATTTIITAPSPQTTELPPPPVDTLSTPIVEETYREPILNLAEVFARIENINRSAIAAFIPETVDTAVIPLAEQTPAMTIEPVAPVNVNEVPSKMVSYHVIGGVFCNEHNARAFYNKLKARGFEAQLLLNKKINCNRVSYRKLTTMAEAVELMDSLKNTENPEAWILAVKE